MHASDNSRGRVAKFSNKHDVRKIAAIIEQYRRGFAALDAEVLKAIWDRGHDNLIYIALEAAEPVRGWTEIERYYEDATVFLGEVRAMTISDLSVEVFDNVAYAYCTFRFEGALEGKNHIARGRNTFVLIRKEGEWKVIHYHESPLPRSAQTSESGTF